MKHLTTLSIMFALLMQALNPTAVHAAWEEFPTIGDLETGTLIKTADSSAVYFFSKNEQRYAFPDEGSFRTWYANFDSVQTIESDIMDQIPYAGLMRIHPLAYMVKFEGEAEVYFLSAFGLVEHIESAEVAELLYGDYWWHRIIEVPQWQKDLYTISETQLTMEDALSDFMSENEDLSDGLSVSLGNIHFENADVAMMHDESAGVYIYDEPLRFAASDESIDCGYSDCAYNEVTAYEGGSVKFINRTESTLEVYSDEMGWSTGEIAPGEIVIVPVERTVDVAQQLADGIEDDVTAIEHDIEDFNFYLRSDTSVSGVLTRELLSGQAALAYAFELAFGMISTE